MKPTIRQTISLLQTISNNKILTLVPRYFTITTNSNSALFNIDILSNVSSVISNFVKENPNSNNYYIDVQDESNVLGKLEILFNGNSIKFSKNEILILLKIVEKLDLSDFLDILNRTHHSNYFKNTDKIQFYFDSDTSSIKMNFYSLTKFVNLSSNERFIIRTKKNEYKCNVFGILYSNVIHDLILKEPKLDQYFYDFDDDENEFQDICDLFNFNNVKLTKNNSYLIKEIAENLQINSILNEIDKFIENTEKVSEAIDDQQEIIDTTDELFDLLYHIKEKTVDSVAISIQESRWSKNDENVFDLASFVFQVAKTDINLQQYLIDLLIKLDENKKGKLDLLLPYIVNHLLTLLQSMENSNFNSSDLPFAFMFKMYQRGLIPKDKFDNRLKKLWSNNNTHFISWFLPELVELCSNNINVDFSKSRIKIIKNKKATNTCTFYSNGSKNIEEYKRIRDRCDYENDIIKSLREDDVDTFQSIVSKDINTLLKNTINANIFENFNNSRTRYLNYAAAYGSIKCFKYMLLNNEEIDSSTFEMAIIGGNIELIRIVDNEKIKPVEKVLRYGGVRIDDPILNALSQSIKRHRNDIFDWILEKNFEKIKQDDTSKYLFEWSVLNGNAHSLVQLIDNGFNFHNCSNIYSRLIELSFQNGYYLFSKFLIKLINKNASFNILINSEITVFFDNIYIFKLYIDKMSADDILKALIVASKNNSMNIIKYFFESLYINKKVLIDSSKITNLLKNCIQFNSKEIMDYLIDDVKILSLFNVYSFFDLLTESQKSDNLQLAIKISELIYKHNSNNDFTKALKYSAELNQIEIVKFYIDNKYSIDYDSLVSQISSIASIKVDVFSLIFDNVDSFMQEKIINTIDDAILLKNIPIVEYLLNKNAPLDDALIQAVNTDNLDLVELILNKNSEPSYVNKRIMNETALLNAIKIDNTSILQRLLSIPGIDPNIHNKDFITPLLLAAKLNKVDSLNMIFDFYGENIKNQKNQLESVIKIIIDTNNQKNSSFNEILLKIVNLKCINPNIRSNTNTLLTYACMSNFINLVKALLEYDTIDVNLNIPENGNTPLIIAIKCSKNEIIELLLNHPKININQKNFNGESPLIFSALDSKRLKITELLLKHEKFDPVESNINLAFYLSYFPNKDLFIPIDSVDVNYIPFESKDMNYYEMSGTKIVLTSLRKAILKKNIALINSIINHPSFIKDKDQIIVDIQIAFSENSQEIISLLFELLKEYDIDINSPIFNGKNALFDEISSKSRVDMISFILNFPGFDSSKSDIVNAFILTYTRSDLLQKYGDSKANLNFIEKTSLIYDFDCQHDHLINDKIENEGNSFLISMYSTIFIERGIDPNKSYDFGYPLQFAIQNNFYILFHCLIKLNKVDLNMKIKLNPRYRGDQQSNLTNYLNLIASCGRIKMLKEILSNHLIDINVTNSEEETPLMDASQKGQLECVEYLFTFDDLDFLHRNKKGDDALEMARMAINAANTNDKENEPKKEITNKDGYLQELLRLTTKLNDLKNIRKARFRSIRNIAIPAIAARPTATNNSTSLSKS